MKRLIALLFLLFTSQQASALCMSGICSCTVSTTSVAFGAFNPLSGTSQDSDGNVGLGCSGNSSLAGMAIPYTIALSKGGSTTYATRRMANGTSYLTYNLYVDATYSSIWGDGTGGTTTISGTIVLDAMGLFPAQNFPVRGRVTSGQKTAVPGPYMDSITVTVTYF